MVMIPGEYYTEEKSVMLTQSEIENILGELETAEHNLFIFLNYQKIIDKLKAII